MEGQCVGSSCGETTCGAGQECRDGQCIVTDCTDVVCSTSFSCRNGVCYPVDCSGTVCLGHELTVVLTGSGSGSVTSRPSAIACPKACRALLEEGTTLTLDAVPAPGSKLVGFTGACSASPCQVTMSADRTVTATFARVETFTAMGTTTAAGRLSGGALKLEAQVGSAVSPQVAAGGGMKLEVGSHLAPGQQR
ncbi:MAG: hypothetical protein HY901_15845 [Deltaproteobacteria bacterium]|nr:hypothetical protein [Deltaproteobacteria bacterium]